MARVCQTPGCGMTCQRTYCTPCRFMRARARKAGKDPDALGWRQMDAAYWNRREKAA